MSTSDRFHLVFEAKGGRHVPAGIFDEQLLERARRLVAYHSRDRKIKATLPPIEVGIIRNESLNACTALTGGQGYIGLNWGMCGLIFLVFNRMLAHPEVLKDVGHSSKENIRDRDLWFPPRSISELHDQIGKVEIPIPADEARWKYGQILLVTAFDFIVLHELAHLLNGHVALIQERAGKPMRNGEAPGVDPLLRQCLEMDADCFAVAQFMGFLGDPAYPASNGASAEMLVFELVFSVYSMLRLDGFGEYSGSTHHPSPGIRRVMILDTIGTWIDKLQGKVDAESLRSAVLRAVRESERAFVELFGGEIPQAELNRSVSTDARSQIAKILEGWRSMLPELERLSFRGGLFGSTE